MKQSALSRRKVTGKTKAKGGALSFEIKAAIVVAAGILVLGIIYWSAIQEKAPAPAAQGTATSSSQPTATASDGLAGRYKFQVGSPGPGQPAPMFHLPASDGGQFDLASQHGHPVLLYFQEGLTCQPCWDQLRDITTNFKSFQALGIDKIVSITTDPIGQIEQKLANENLSALVLSDSDLAVSGAYDTNSYGMMGRSRDGHSFILVGSDGRIVWRADYGGAPDYTMNLPVKYLLADLRRGLSNGAQ
jgi:peroxiredoxin Q/BCP